MIASEPQTARAVATWLTDGFVSNEEFELAVYNTIINLQSMGEISAK